MATRPTMTIRIELTLSHWMGARGVLRLDAATPDAAPAKLRLGESEMLNAEPDEMIEYSGVLATEDPWMLKLYSYDPDKRMYAPRWTAMRLAISPRTVAADLGTPAGVAALWNHFTWGSPSLGRFLTLAAKGGKLECTLALSTRALAGYGTSAEQLDAGMNAGLSAGLSLIDRPEFKRAKGDDGGSYDNPDEMRYKRLRVNEGSLTALPMIRQAGLTGRTSGDANA